MDEPATVFALAPIQCWQRSRARQISTLLQPGAPQGSSAQVEVETGLEYAVAHHLLEGAETAARAYDQGTFAWYSNTSPAGLAPLRTPTAVGPRIILSPDLMNLSRSRISETPYFLINPETTSAAKELRQLAVNAFNAAVDAGFGALLAGHAAVVVFLRRKQLRDTLDSWTITRLPGTIFTDHVGEPAVLARDLVHEAGHNWLNDGLAACGVKIGNEMRFFSPWKQAIRPAFGFLHACWAFPLTMIYTARVLGELSGPVRAFLATYLAQQRDLLAATDGDHTRALALVPDEDLRRRLQQAHRTARAL
ncbi:MAG: aKG-HExxH-type peptide beta-hydroxylase [Egibacteraceae bacterium]